MRGAREQRAAALDTAADLWERKALDLLAEARKLRDAARFLRWRAAMVAARRALRSAVPSPEGGTP